ncbi:hypothetical protein EVA_03861 [gut metagenome]|uniref:Uncharacterized protein n=1 Tax=gut metagenome TaxID=749906 RepID=J9GKZ5_9ZZZZ
MQGVSNNKPDFRIQVKGLFGTDVKIFEVIGGENEKAAPKKKRDVSRIDRSPVVSSSPSQKQKRKRI